MGDVVAFRGKKFNENLAQRMIEKGGVPIGDEAMNYDEMQAATNAFYNDLIFGPAIAINKAIDSGTAANEEIT